MNVEINENFDILPSSKTVHLSGRLVLFPTKQTQVKNQMAVLIAVVRTPVLPGVLCVCFN